MSLFCHPKWIFDGLSADILQESPDRHSSLYHVIKAHDVALTKKEDYMGAAILCKSEEVVGSEHATPGVLMFTSSVQLSFRNQRARELCGEIIRYENTKTANGVLPLTVTSLADEIQSLLRIKTESKDWEQFQIRRVVGGSNNPILLCGFGVLDANMKHSRIVIVMQETGPAFWHNRVLDKSKEKFQLSVRETDILLHLLKGCTNKEIANALGVSEQTVKEHMKHLFDKAGVTTRTGLVMKAVLCEVQCETRTYSSESSELPRAASRPPFSSQPYNPQRDEPCRQTLPRNGIELMNSSNQAPYAGGTPHWYQDG